VNFTAPPVNGFRGLRRSKAVAQNLLSCKRLAPLAVVRPFSVSRSGSLGTKRNRQGLRPYATFSAFELSHSLVNMTQWLTAMVASGANLGDPWTCN
jgi:hypothetical protein